MAGAKYRHQASVTPLKEKLFQEHLKMRGKEAERTCVVDVGHLANGWGLALQQVQGPPVGQKVLKL